MQMTPSALTRGRDLARRALDRVRPVYIQRLSLFTVACMFITYVSGTIVTGTQSGQGCGNSWPLCGGKFVPEFAFHTAVEFTHRVITGLVTFMVIGLAAGALWFWRSRREVALLAPSMVIALFAEAFLGALIVAHPKSAPLIAVHFGSSLVLFTSILLLAAVLTQLDGWDTLRDLRVPAGMRWLAFGLAAYTYVVGYLGAYMRVRGDVLACQDWPTCQGSLFPGFAGDVGVVFTHRFSAAILVVGVLWLFLWTRRRRATRPDLYRGAQWALAFVLAQGAVGALIVGSKAALISTLTHAALVTLLFASLAYVALHTLPRPARATH